MAVNKNFVVKNGLEVATDVILADATSKNVGIGSTIPVNTLDVRGGIGATDSFVTGISTVVSELNVGTGGTVLTVNQSPGRVGVGSEIPEYLLDVRSGVAAGTTALYVQGDVRITGDLNVEDITLTDISASSLNISGLTTLGGHVDINSFVDIFQSLSVTGVSTFASDVDINASADISGDLVIQDALNVSGLSTFGSEVDINADLNVSGVVTATSFTGLGQIGVGSEGTFIGTGVTMVDFKSSNAGNTVDVTTGIATVTVQTGASIGLVIALGG